MTNFYEHDYEGSGSGKVGNLSTSWATISLLRRNVINGVKYNTS
jgi:hypothetical protein